MFIQQRILCYDIYKLQSHMFEEAQVLLNDSYIFGELVKRNYV